MDKRHLIQFSNDNVGCNKIWIHSASYGEYEMAKPYVDVLKQDVNNRFIVSFFSPSGYENIVFEDPRFCKIYLPLDTYKHQKQVVDIIKPDHVVFIKYEFWFNLLRVLKDKNIPYYYTSLNLNKSSYLFSFYMKPFLSLIKKSKRIYSHNVHSKEVLLEYDFDNVEVLGDTRILKVLETKAKILEKLNGLIINPL